METPTSTIPPPSLCSSPIMNPVDDPNFAPTVSMQDLERPDPASNDTPKSQQKKRKSWGQVLPEPKTSLPPRKRAKTEDEKEQRRIERVKRNRLAAHNSRERKRQETEDLQLQNDELHAQLRLMQEHIVQMESQIRAYQAGTTPPPLRTSFAASSTVDPREDSLLSSREASVDSHSSTPIKFNESHSPLIKVESETATLMPDLTQHSAAMLCEDLQCQSDIASVSSLSTNPSQLSNQNWIQVAVFYLISLNIHLCFQTLLLTTWSTFPNWTNRMLNLSQSSSSRRSNQTTAPSPHHFLPQQWDRVFSSLPLPHRSLLRLATIFTHSATLLTSPAPSSWGRQQWQHQQQQRLQMTLAQGFPTNLTLAQRLSLATSLALVSAFSARTDASLAASDAPAPAASLHENRLAQAQAADPDLRAMTPTNRLEEMRRALHRRMDAEHQSPSGQGQSENLNVHDEVQLVSDMLGMYFQEWNGIKKGDGRLINFRSER